MFESCETAVEWIVEVGRYFEDINEELQNNPHNVSKDEIIKRIMSAMQCDKRMAHSMVIQGGRCGGGKTLETIKELPEQIIIGHQMLLLYDYENYCGDKRSMGEVPFDFYEWMKMNIHSSEQGIEPESLREWSIDDSSLKPDEASSGRRIYKCGHCGHVGPGKHAATSEGLSAPWCSNCERNSKMELRSEEPKEIPGRPLKPKTESVMDFGDLLAEMHPGTIEMVFVKPAIIQIIEDYNDYLANVEPGNQETIMARNKYLQIAALVLEKEIIEGLRRLEMDKSFSPEGPFKDGETLEDIPKCSIPGCKETYVRYFIGFKDGQKYYCGDCEKSDFDILQKMADEAGEEVGEYDAPLWAITMLYEAPEDDDTRIWLVRGHNMAQAIVNATDGEYEHEFLSEPWSMAQGSFSPLGIRHPTVSECEEAGTDYLPPEPEEEQVDQ